MSTPIVIPEIRITLPGPQGSQGPGGGAENPAVEIFLHCDDDDTVHALRCVKIHGAYVLELDQADSTP